MTVPLTVRLGDEMITRQVDNLTFRRNIHGDAECSFQLSRPLRHKVAPFERLRVYDGRSGDIVWEGRVEDPGRSNDEGEQFDMSAMGDQVRAKDRATGYVAIDQDLSRWGREQNDRATSAEASATNVPSNDKTDGLVMQYNPGQPVDETSAIVMVYRAIENAGMLVGGITYTVVAGLTNTAWEARLWAEQNPAGTASQIRADTYSTTPNDRVATIGSGTPLPAGTTALQLIAKRVGTATTVGNDSAWAAFYGVVVKAARYNLDGTLNTTNADYATGRGVYPHEVVIDLLVRLLPNYDAATASIDTSSTYQINQFAFPDGVTAEQAFTELMTFEPNFYYHVGHTDPATGRNAFAWRKWQTRVRYEFSLREGLSIPGADAERYNRVTVRWVDKRGRPRTSVYTAGTTISGTFVPPVAELDAQGLIREPEPQDLSDEVGSQAAADKFAAEFLLAHGTPPVSGTLTVAGKVYDADCGGYVHPWEIEPGHLGRIRELADSPGDLAVTARNGKSVFRIVGMSYQTSTNTAELELDAPPRNDQVMLAEVIKRRKRRR